MVTSNHIPRASHPHLAITPTGRIAPIEPVVVAPLAGRRILVAHESSEITDVLVDIFNAAGARVATAHDANEANLSIGWGGLDLIFLDAALPHATDVLDLLADCRPKLLPRTIVLTTDLPDGQAKSRLRTSYPKTLFCDSWLVDLVGIAARALAASARRSAAAA
jgi:CheY-like chemotaxis protein